MTDKTLPSLMVASFFVACMHDKIELRNRATKTKFLKGNKYATQNCDGELEDE